MSGRTTKGCTHTIASPPRLTFLRNRKTGGCFYLSFSIFPFLWPHFFSVIRKFCTQDFTNLPCIGIECGGLQKQWARWHPHSCSWWLRLEGRCRRTTTRQPWHMMNKYNRAISPQNTHFGRSRKKVLLSDHYLRSPMMYNQMLVN